MRGIPGSGKSYAAKALFDHFTEKSMSVVINSTDEFFMKNGEYKWNPASVGFAHNWNQKRTQQAMLDKLNAIIVDNTNTTWKEIEPYARMAKDNGYFIIIVEPTTEWAKDAVECSKRNQHSVPLASIEKMLARWQDTDTVIKPKLEEFYV